jgi:ATP-binding cassette subfamily G (WHITE) protein 2 (SNQ2)
VSLHLEVNLHAIPLLTAFASPLTYYIKGQLGTVLHGLPVICDGEDMARFNPPPGQTCDAYAGQWAAQTGGYLTNPTATSMCGYCQYSNGDQYLQTLDSPYNFRWQSFGIFLGFTIFNAGMAFVLYWYFRVRGYGLGVDWVIFKVTGLFKKRQSHK